MATQFTPGPWNRDYGNYVYQGESPDLKENQRLIAICEPPYSKTQSDWNEAFANARLIASAPELLEALIDALDLLEKYEVKIEAEFGLGGSIQDIESRGYLPVEIQNARAAITKATGD